MNLIDAIAQPRILLACLCFGCVNLLLANCEQHFFTRMAEHSITAWLAEHVYLPLARIFSILLFISLAYPALFGLREAPGIFSLLADGEHRVSHLINLGFLLSLLLPLLPVLGRLPSLVLPAQGLLAAAMLFTWLARTRDLEVSLWPGWITMGLVLLWAVLGQRIAVWIAQQCGDHWNTHNTSEDQNRVYYEMAILFFQIPAILLYTLSLGEQLH